MRTSLKKYHTGTGCVYSKYVQLSHNNLTFFPHLICNSNLLTRHIPLSIRHIQGQTKTAEFPGSPRSTVHLIWTPVPSSLTLPPEQSAARWGFLLVAADTSAGAEDVFDQGLELMATGDLRPSHQKAWRELWLRSTVEVAGSETLCRAVIGCLFYLLSAFPSIHDASSSFGGVSPGGLSNGGDGQDYCGHVFWDQV